MRRPDGDWHLAEDADVGRGVVAGLMQRAQMGADRRAQALRDRRLRRQRGQRLLHAACTRRTPMFRISVTITSFDAK